MQLHILMLLSQLFLMMLKLLRIPYQNKGLYFLALRKVCSLTKVQNISLVSLRICAIILALNIVQDILTFPERMNWLRARTNTLVHLFEPRRSKLLFIGHTKQNFLTLLITPKFSFNLNFPHMKWYLKNPRVRINFHLEPTRDEKSICTNSFCRYLRTHSQNC